MKTAEEKLRERVVNIISGWKGIIKGSKEHQQILDIYNSYRPLARGYMLQPKDHWCAGTVSAAWIAAGIADYTGTECSCSSFIKVAKAKGYWIESDSYIPKIGDAILYDWDDDGIGENLGAPEHIGIVTDVIKQNNKIVVTEGNMGNPSQVGERQLDINGRFIRGFIAPNYAIIAKRIGLTDDDVLQEEEEMTQEKFNEMMNVWLATQAAKEPSAWSEKARAWAEGKKYIQGDEKGNKMYKKPLTREEFVQVLYRIVNDN